MSSEKNLATIAALLAKAESTDSPHEAEALTAAAQKLASRHSIELAVARAHTQKAQQRERPEEQTVEIGAKGTRGLAQYTRLFLQVAKANDLDCLIASNSTRVWAYGFPTDIEATRALYASLAIQMSRAADDFMRSDERWAITEMVFDPESDTYYSPKPVHATVVRRNFCEGFTERISERLMQAKSAAQAEIEAATGASGSAGLSSTALALRDKKAEVAEAYEEAKVRLKARGSWRGSRATGYAHGAYQGGSAAADRANLSGPGAAAIGA